MKKAKSKKAKAVLFNVSIVIKLKWQTGANSQVQELMEYAVCVSSDIKVLRTPSGADVTLNVEYYAILNNLNIPQNSLVYF